MTPKRKLTIAASLVAVAVTVALCGPKPKVYTYQGKTVEEWFGEFSTFLRLHHEYCGFARMLGEKESFIAFREMGTNAVPFLASRMTRDLRRSRLEVWTSKLPARFRPRTRKAPDAEREEEVKGAAFLLAYYEPPREMLRELLKPALSATNTYQRFWAMELTSSCRVPPPKRLHPSQRAFNVE